MIPYGIKRKTIKKPKYRYHWYKSARTLLKNRRLSYTDKSIVLG